MKNTLLALLVAGLWAITLVERCEAAPSEGERAAFAHYNLGKHGLALEGYDPVAYFPEGGGAAREGKAEHEITRAGVRYRFATPANRELFLGAPERYEPAYGGWCAYAMGSSAEKVEIDPESFRVRGGRLFVFYDGFLNDTRKKWLKDEDGLRVRANRAWREISGETAARDVGAFNLGRGDLLLAGYDPVAYLALDAVATPGKPELELAHDGLRLRFSSEKNRESFRADPSRYEPAYGGWCAWAMSKGKRVDVDPRAFLVQDGELLLFASPGTRADWVEGQPGLRAQADARWAVILHGE